MNSMPKTIKIVGWVRLSLLAMMGIASSASAVSITADTTVGESEVANYVNEDIDIAAGSTLTFSELTTARTFTGKLTGGGNFVVKSAAQNTTARITFAGDASAFAGETCVTNQFFTSTGPGAISPVRLRYYMTAAGKSYLNGTGTYGCEVDARPCDTHPQGLVVPSGVTLAGHVYWRGGRLCGPGTVSGLVTIDGSNSLYGQDSIHFAGGVTSTGLGQGNLNADSSSYHIDSTVTKLNQVTTLGNCVYFGVDEALDTAQLIRFGASYNRSGGWDLQGHSQRCGGIDTVNTGSNMENTYFRSASPATLVCDQNQSDQYFHGNLLGAFTLDYSSSAGKTFTLAGTNNNTTGKLIVRSGTLALATNSVFSALSGIEVAGTGTLEFKTLADGAGDVLSEANISSGAVTLKLADTGTLKIPAGVTLMVNSASVDGSYVAIGTYTSASAEMASHLVGDGTLMVVNDGAVSTEGAAFSWTGAGSDALLTTAGNWKDGVAPTFDGTERLVFGDDATTTNAIVVGTKSVYAIDIATTNNFTLVGTDASAKILMGAGGFSFTNTVLATTNRHSLSVAVELEYLPQTWRVAHNSSFETTQPWAGRFADERWALTLDARGRVYFWGDNSALETTLIITNCTTVWSQPYVYNEKGLGATNRETWIIGCLPRFMNSSRPMTNNVPLRIRNNVTNSSHGYFNHSGSYELYFDAPVTYYGIPGEMYLNGKVHFRGGIYREDTLGLTIRFPGANNWIEGEGVRINVALALDYGGIFNIASTNNAWTELKNYKCTVCCHNPHVLPAGAVLLFAADGVYRGNAVLDMNGCDQSVGKVYTAVPVSDWGTYVQTVTSAMPATFTIKSTSNMLIPLRFTGAASLVLDAPVTLSLTNHPSTTTGTLEVRQGTVKLLSGAGWTAVTNVVVAGGTLAVGPSVGATAFGSEQGKSDAVMRVASGGVVEIAEGETAYVLNLIVTENGKETYKNVGIYGGVDAGLDAAHTLSCLAGKGRLHVQNNPHQGTMIIVH